MKTIASVIAGVFLCGVASISFADPDKDESGHWRYSNERRADNHERRADRHERRVHKGGDYEEEYWDGNCKVERKWERNGKYKEERECEGSRRHERRVHKGGDYEEEYWDGNCKVERKWERNGKYKEERKCEGSRPRAAASSFDPYRYPNAMGQRPPRVILELPRR